MLARGMEIAVDNAAAMTFEDAAAFAEFAARCGPKDLLAACQRRLAVLVRKPSLVAFCGNYGALAPSNRLVELCSPSVVAGVMAILCHVAAAARIPQTAIPAAADILRSNVMAEAKAFLDDAAGGSGVLFAINKAAIDAKAGQGLMQFGVTWTLSWDAEYDSDDAVNKAFGTELRSDSHKSATFVLGLVNQLDVGKSSIVRLEEKVARECWSTSHVPAAEFWDDDAGWFVYGHAIVFVRIVSVADLPAAAAPAAAAPAAQ